MDSPIQNLADSKWMALALAEARKGLGLTSPNPAVGAVLVAQNADGSSQLIATGYHKRAGMPHAEREALAAAYDSPLAHLVPNSTLYVSLEPCSSWGRTPPCTQGIIEAGIKRVVYACKDPDVRHQGRAAVVLAEAGIEVTQGILEHEAMELLRPWSYAVTHGRPWVLAKIATSLDGRLSRAHTPWLSDSPSLSYGQELRAQSDAILVGGGTVRQDNPSLTLRDESVRARYVGKEQPWRVVLSRNGEALKSQLVNHQLFNDKFAQKTLLWGEVKNWHEELLEPLYKQFGVVQLMLECGGELLRPMLEAGIINEWVQIISPYLVGGPHELVGGEAYLGRELELCERCIIESGRDIVLRGTLK